MEELMQGKNPEQGNMAEVEHGETMKMTEDVALTRRESSREIK
jgi:hypothetical protein